MKGLHIFGRDILTTRYSNFELSLSTTCRQSLTFLTLGVDHIHIGNITMILSTVSKGSRSHSVEQNTPGHSA